MAYATTAQVAAEFKDITFSSTTSVKDTEVDRFIEESDAEIDSILGTRFTVPVTAPASAPLLRMYSIWLTTCRIEYIMKVKTGDGRLEQYNKACGKREEALEALEKIVKGKMTLPDAELISSSDGVRSYGTDVCLEHTFKKGVNQW